VRGAVLRWMYRGGRPNRVAALLNRVSAIVGSAGLWPNRLVTLEVRGRRTVPSRFHWWWLTTRANAILWRCWVKARIGCPTCEQPEGRRSFAIGAVKRLEEVDPRARGPVLRQGSPPSHPGGSGSSASGV
jgi:hypothetical protein